MALNFPNTGLTEGLEYTGDNGVTYIYDGEKWIGHAVGQPAGTNSITNNGKTVQVDGDGNLVIPIGAIIKDAEGTQYGGGGPALGDYTFFGPVLNVPTGEAHINAGGVGVRNSAEIKTVITENSGSITSAEIALQAGNGGISAQVYGPWDNSGIHGSGGPTLVYAGVENLSPPDFPSNLPGFAGFVAIDPGVTSQYAVSSGEDGKIFVSFGEPITTESYIAALGVLTDNINLETGRALLNGILVDPNYTTINGKSSIIMSTDRGTILLGNQAECIGGENHFHIMKEDASAVDLFFGDDNNYVKLPGNGETAYGVEIGTNVGSAYTWRFGTDGKLTLPATPNGGGGGVVIFPSATTGTQAMIDYGNDRQGGAFELTNTDGTNRVYLGLNLDSSPAGGIATIAVGNVQTNEYKNWYFNADGYLSMESLYLQGFLKGVDGSTGSTGQVLTRQSNGGVAWADSTGGGGAPDGGVADNSAGLTITTYTLPTRQYDTSGSVTYNVASAGASAAGIIIKGLTVDHTQVIDGSFDQGDNTVSWNDTISGDLWEQVASVTAFVTDSRGYTFYALVTDMWEVPHGPCLVEGTLITMADGSHKAIEDITHGELIRVWNFDLGEFSEAQPIWVKAAEETTEHGVYTFSDGTQLRTVGHHVFNKEAGAFTKLKYAETPVGTTTFNEQGLEVTLVSKERVVAPTRYYNVWTQYHLNLFANGILTSNRFNNIYPIVDMKFVKDDRALRSLNEFAGIDEKYIKGLRLQEQTYSLEYISDYVHNRLERLDIANQVEQGI